MMVIEQTAVPATALPVAALKDHLRLGTGFADDDLQDGLVEGYLRAALAAIEGRIGKALIARRFILTLDRWRGTQEQALPVAPVSAVVSVALVDAAGATQPVPSERVRLAPDLHRPKLSVRGGGLPPIPEDGRVEIVFDAGFGGTWTEVPADLGQAVFLLAAELYERRHDDGARNPALPMTVQALIERWRTVRVLGGGAA